MKRGEPLRRSGFARPVLERIPQPLYAIARPSKEWAPAANEPQPKALPVRSEAYRRLVAAMPCAHCRKAGPSQAAHADQGKGIAIKASDLTCYPLCPRCHALMGASGVLMRDQRRALEARYGAETMAAIAASGAWPKGLLSEVPPE